MNRLQGYPDPGKGLRLHLNENTGGCSPRVLDAIKKMQTTDVSTYPSYPELVRACARHFDVDADWVLLTNGLDEGILMAAVGHISRARIHDAETIIPLPAFDPYPNSTSAAGATAVRIPPGPDFVFPTDAVIAAVTPRTRMIFLNTPSNPTGRLIPIPDLRRIAEAAPRAVVLIDEAYIEFGGTSFMPDLRNYPNVLVGRTFSKAYGLAGMRVGVVIGSPNRSIRCARSLCRSTSMRLRWRQRWRRSRITSSFRSTPRRSPSRASASTRRASVSVSNTGRARQTSSWFESATR
jgi:histidinol-phosphate aminotransferase